MAARHVLAERHTQKRQDLAQALVSFLVRNIQAKRAAILERVEATTGPILETQRRESLELEKVDHALTELGLNDTVDRP